MLLIHGNARIVPGTLGQARLLCLGEHLHSGWLLHGCGVGHAAVAPPWALLALASVSASQQVPALQSQRLSPSGTLLPTQRALLPPPAVARSCLCPFGHPGQGWSSAHRNQYKRTRQNIEVSPYPLVKSHGFKSLGPSPAIMVPSLGPPPVLKIQRPPWLKGSATSLTSPNVAPPP